MCIGLDCAVVCMMLCRRQLLGAITHCFLHNYCIQASGARKKAKNSSAVQQPSGTTPAGFNSHCK